MTPATSTLGRSRTSGFRSSWRSEAATRSDETCYHTRDAMHVSSTHSSRRRQGIAYAVALTAEPGLPVASLAPEPSCADDVAPILAERCRTCHGPSQQLSLYSLFDRESALKGGQKGRAILPGDA